MPDPQERAAHQTSRRARSAIAADVQRLRADAGINVAALARAAGADASFIRRIESGSAQPSITTYARLALALGADLSLRLYPNTGPTIRDRHQALIAEAVLRSLHGRWRAYSEIAVRRPSRGWIDLGLHDPRSGLLVAVEIQSELRRLEQLIRWSAEKVASLPSWEGWTHLGPATVASQLLLVRDTKTTRAVAREFRRQLSVAFPANPDDALDSLFGSGAWPGSAILWASNRGDVDGLPRIVARR